MRIIFATGNPGKMKEVRMILADLNAEILSMKEAGIDIPIEEDGLTFEENAVIKARAVHSCVPDAIVLADDSGLEVDYLDRQPGVYSARYMGEDTPYEVKNAAIIRKLAGAAERERTARFVSAIAAALPDGSILTTEGVIEGVIAHEPAGDGGFGYDPIFYVPEFHATTAELTPEQKNAVSHRGKALRAMKNKLIRYFEVYDRDENTDRQ